MASETDGSAVKAKEAGEEESDRGGRGATSFELTPAMTDAIAQRVVEKLTATLLGCTTKATLGACPPGASTSSTGRLGRK